MICEKHRIEMRQTAFGFVCDVCAEESFAAVDAELVAEASPSAAPASSEPEWARDPVEQQLIPDFDGATIVQGRDKPRLFPQLQRVAETMRNGRWQTLGQIAEATGDPEASVSARLRDLRKVKFGGHEIEREYVESGLHRYRLIVNEQAAFPLGYGDPETDDET